MGLSLAGWRAEGLYDVFGIRPRLVIRST